MRGKKITKKCFLFVKVRSQILCEKTLPQRAITLTKNYLVYHQFAKEYIKDAKLLHPEIEKTEYNYYEKAEK